MKTKITATYFFNAKDDEESKRAFAIVAQHAATAGEEIGAAPDLAIKRTREHKKKAV